MGSTGSQDPGLGQGPYLNPLSTPQTDYFHLFICVAIVAIYGDDVIEQQLATDQMLLHFGNLAMHMNGELVLRKVSVAPNMQPCPPLYRTPPLLPELHPYKAPYKLHPPHLQIPAHMQSPAPTLHPGSSPSRSACMASAQGTHQADKRGPSPRGRNRLLILTHRSSTMRHLTHSPELRKLSKRFREGRWPTFYPRLVG